MIDHDSIVIIMAVMWIATNFAGAGFAIARLYRKTPVSTFNLGALNLGSKSNFDRRRVILKYVPIGLGALLALAIISSESTRKMLGF
jgi:hypothetical protein